MDNNYFEIEIAMSQSVETMSFSDVCTSWCFTGYLGRKPALQTGDVGMRAGRVIHGRIMGNAA